MKNCTLQNNFKSPESKKKQLVNSFLAAQAQNGWAPQSFHHNFSRPPRLS
jgi:hypothetical protein